MDVSTWPGTIIVLTASRSLAGKSWAFRWIVGGMKRVMREYPGPYLLIEGCARGGDNIGEQAAEMLGWQIKHEPCTDAEWRKYGRGAGHRRNRRMLDYKPHVVIAFPYGEAKGTRGCVAQARRLGIRTMTFTRLRVSRRS